MFDTKGRTVIVTGSAQGFGREFAERLLRDGGAKVCLSDVNEKAGLETSRELGEKYSEDRVHFVK